MKFNEIVAKIISINEGEYGGWEPEAGDNSSDNPTMAYMGRPEDIHFYADLDGRVRSLQNGVKNRGLTYTTVYVKPSKDGWYYTLKPKEDFHAALVPEQEIQK